jgi:hypothetical protein
MDMRKQLELLIFSVVCIFVNFLMQIVIEIVFAERFASLRENGY